MTNPQNRLQDSLLQLKDAGAITSSAAAQVGGSAQVIDLGHDGVEDFDVQIDVSSIDYASANEVYDVIIEGCNTSDFSTGSPDIVHLGTLHLADADDARGATNIDGPTGQHVLRCRNTYGTTPYRYVRAYTNVAGTTPSINYTAQIIKRD